jgi:hypothetical protein
MVEVVLRAQKWDLTAMSERFVVGPASGRVLSGIQGEWLSIACAAYCASKKKDVSAAAAVAHRIDADLKQQGEVFEEIVRAGDGVGVLAASTLIAHNLGDLDRVMDQWNLEHNDPLRLDWYKAGHELIPTPRDKKQALALAFRQSAYDSNRKHTRRSLLDAGSLNKLTLGTTTMADENNRHFALREAKGLRTRRDLLTPVAPCFDDWGAGVATLPTVEVAQAHTHTHTHTHTNTHIDVRLCVFVLLCVRVRNGIPLHSLSPSSRRFSVWCWAMSSAQKVSVWHTRVLWLPLTHIVPGASRRCHQTYLPRSLLAHLA